MVRCPTLRSIWPPEQARPQLLPSQCRLNCVLNGLLLKRKLSYVLCGPLANAAVELAARVSSTAAVAQSITIELCIELDTFEKKTDSNQMLLEANTALHVC